MSRAANVGSALRAKRKRQDGERRAAERLLSPIADVQLKDVGRLLGSAFGQKQSVKGRAAARRLFGQRFPADFE